MTPGDGGHLKCEVGRYKSRWSSTEELLEFLYEVHLVKIVVIVRQRRPFLVRSNRPAL